MSIYVRRGRVAAVPGPPSKATIWRVLTEVDAASVDASVGAWLWERGERGEPSGTTEEPTDPVHTTTTGCDATATASATDSDLIRPMLLAVDGRTVRGAVNAQGDQTHMLAVMTHHQGLVIAQTEVDEKTNEVRREVPCRISHSVRRNSEESSWIRRLTCVRKTSRNSSPPPDGPAADPTDHSPSSADGFVDLLDRSVRLAGGRRDARDWAAERAWHLAQCLKAHARDLLQAANQAQFDAITIRLGQQATALVDGSWDPVEQEGEPTVTPRAARRLSRVLPALVLFGAAFAIGYIPGLTGTSLLTIRLSLVIPALLSLIPAGRAERDLMLNAVRDAVARVR